MTMDAHEHRHELPRDTGVSPVLTITSTGETPVSRGGCTFFSLTGRQSESRTSKIQHLEIRHP